MARYNKIQVISTALETGLVPVFYNEDLETSKAVLKACYDGGISMFEFTNRGDFAHEIFGGLVKYANDKLPGMILGAGSVIDTAKFEFVAKSLMERFPKATKVAITLRGSVNADHNTWGAVLYDGKTLFASRRYDITDIVDRVGGGDSFGGGLIYGLLNYGDDQKALDFAVAASCLKHTIEGDYNRVTTKEVETLMSGNGSGRVSR